MIRSYSQIGQDIWVLEKLRYKTNGTFIDIGAYDGIQLSNTYSLESQFGWNGLCVEPNKDLYPKLVTNRPSSKHSSYAVHSYSGLELDFVPADLLSSLKDYIELDSHKEKRQQYLTNLYQVNTISLNELCKQHNICTIDYLSIDTEGSEYDILKTFDINLYCPKVITVEHNCNKFKDSISAYLIYFGYDVIELPFEFWAYKNYES